MFQKISETTDFIKSKTEGHSPQVGIVLGSGLGHIADLVEDKIEIPYSEIPNFHQTTVVGHAGRLAVGKIAGVEVAVFQGRFHYYEGHQLEDVVLPVRVMSQMGIKTLILTNASGGINENYRPGELVYIADHLNLTGNNPLIGPNDDRLGERFPDMTETYNKKLINLFLEAANELGIELKPGIYAGVVGPSYETPAEIQMLKTLGADLVGMSTVPEAIAAHHAGLNVSAISCVTNMAAGISKEKLNHEDVKLVADQAKDKFSNLLFKTIEKMR